MEYNINIINKLFDVMRPTKYWSAENDIKEREKKINEFEKHIEDLEGNVMNSLKKQNKGSLDNLVNSNKPYDKKNIAPNTRKGRVKMVEDYVSEISKLINRGIMMDYEIAQHELDDVKKNFNKMGKKLPGIFDRLAEVASERNTKEWLKMGYFDGAKRSIEWVKNYLEDKPLSKTLSKLEKDTYQLGVDQNVKWAEESLREGDLESAESAIYLAEKYAKKGGKLPKKFSEIKTKWFGSMYQY